MKYILSYVILGISNSLFIEYLGMNEPVCRYWDEIQSNQMKLLHCWFAEYICSCLCLVSLYFKNLASL